VEGTTRTATRSDSAAPRPDRDGRQPAAQTGSMELSRSNPARHRPVLLIVRPLHRFRENTLIALRLGFV